jgi:hypothetical protein
MIPAPSGSHLLLTLKGVKFGPFFKFFLVRHKLPFFGQNCSERELVLSDIQVPVRKGGHAEWLVGKPLHDHTDWPWRKIHFIETELPLTVLF